MIPIAMALAQFAPQIIGLIGGSKAESIAEHVVGIAQTVTGASTPKDALKAIQADPAVALEFQRVVAEKEVELARIDADVTKALFGVRLQAAEAVNETMRAEAASEHWPSYSWRPFIGFVFGINLLIASLVTAGVYLGVMFGARGAAEALSTLPQMIGALGAVNGAALPILGIASWFRGKMQADPAVPTNNRG